MIKSMTAFARAVRQTESAEVTVEARSYNSRYLDLHLKLPYAFAALEDRVKQRVQERIARGRLELRVQIRETAGPGEGFEVDEPRARQYVEALGRLRSLFSLEGGVTLDHLVAAGDIIRPVETERDLEERWPVIREALDQALADLDTMRLREGRALERDFLERLDRLEELLGRVEGLSEGLMELYRDRLLERVGSLAADAAEIDPARIAQEAAILAEKSDVSEEIVRARSHAAQFRSFLSDGEPAGRKLNFLLQEFNREFNTIGSKATRSDISHLVVEAKSEVEKIREQVQNVE